MERKDGDIVEGRDLMLYVDTAATGESPTYTPQAAATNHTVTYSAETKERVTKDTKNGAFADKTVTKLGVSIKSDCLVSVGGPAGWNKLLATFKARKAIKLKYGFADEQQSDSYEEGMFVITSLEQSSPADDDASYSATFENSGPVETKTKGA